MRSKRKRVGDAADDWSVLDLRGTALGAELVTALLGGGTVGAMTDTSIPEAPVLENAGGAADPTGSGEGPRGEAGPAGRDLYVVEAWRVQCGRCGVTDLAEDTRDLDSRGWLAWAPFATLGGDPGGLLFLEAFTLCPRCGGELGIFLQEQAGMEPG